MKSTRWGLSALFFFQGMALAAWFVPLSRVLEAYGLDSITPFAFAASSFAGLVTPLIFGAVVDRHAAPVQVLRWVALASGGLLALATWSIHRHGPPLLVLLLIQMFALLSTPTWSLLTSAALAGIGDAKREFGPIRAFGTLGWMAGCVAVSLLGADASTRAGFAGALLWGVVAAVAFGVPAVEFRGGGESLTIRQRLGLDALELLRVRDHRTVFLTAALVTMPLTAFYPYAPAQMRDLGLQRTSAWMSLAQVTEVVAMFGLGALFARFRLKTILAVGLGFAVLRYLLLSTHVRGSVLLGVSLHGFAFTLFSVAVPVYLNERVESSWRGRAQALLALMTQGIGGVTGYLGTGYWMSWCRTPEGVRWTLFWGVLTGLVLLVLLNFLVSYRGRGRAAEAG